MTKKRIEITNDNWEDIVYSALEIAGIDVEFLNQLKIHMLQYIDTGFHYIGWYVNDDEIPDLKMYIGHKINTIIPSINMYLYYGLSILGDTVQIPKGTEINRHFESKGDSVGEISPINAVVGEITSPDSKRHSETSSDYTDNHKTTDDYIKAFRFSEKYKSLVTIIGELLANTIIAEFNTLY